ncbi:MAG: DMT family transporter [Bdellovibrionales bacterium]|nr:DMT family transporter [Bdellovibrionales bacterium]
MVRIAATSGRVLAALLAVQLLFGINYVVSKFVLHAFPPLVWASGRIIIASIIMLAVALLLRRKHPKPDRKFFVPLIFFALLGTVINQASFLVGLNYTTSTNSAILNTLIPIFTLLIVTLRGQEPATPRRVLGFVSAFVGVLIMRRVEEFTLSNTTWIGDLLTILNCLSYAIFLSYGKKFLEKHDPIWTTTWLFFYGSIGLTLLAIPDYSRFHMPVINSQLAWAMVFAIVGATLLTYFLNFWALANAKSSMVALFIYLQPVVASFIAWIWMNETVGARTVLASLFILIGFVMALSPEKRWYEVLLGLGRAFKPTKI